ncbi:MAG TPA: TIGR03663 family protein [Anaerolineae bacterium]|nr:TIGR03663 family protein [Anaerolineae bacterium]
MTVKESSFPRKVSFDTPITTLFALNWEMVLYTTFFVIAVFTRFYDLGARVMSHDESLHTLYSWNLYAGKGYQHDPLMHGPFQFHIVALTYLLFGDNDFTARVPAAIFGIVLVIMPYFFRPWLGRTGALATSFMILISPGLLYYSRYIRNEAYLHIWMLLMTLALFQFMRTRSARWLIVGAVAVALSRATKEVSMIHGYIGFSFIAAMWLWESLPPARQQLVRYIMLGVTAILAALSAYLLSQAGTLETAGGSESWLVGHADTFVMITGLLVSLLVIQRGADQVNRPISRMIASLGDYKADLAKAVLAAIVVFILLYTTFFSNLYGLYTGTVGGIAYWLEQHGVQRGGQPWYYYLMLVPLYEFLPFFIGLIGGLVYLFRGKFPSHLKEEAGVEGTPQPADGGTFAAYLIYWTLLSWLIFSWAGEKMPWLSTHITLPLTFLAGHVLQLVFDRFDWSAARQRGGLLLAGAILLIPAGLVAMATATPFQSQSLQAMQETSQFIAGLVVLLALAVVSYLYGRRLGRSLALRVALATTLFVMSLLTIRFAWLFNYVNYDYVNEIMVYAHASPDVKLALGQIEEISRRTVGDKMIRLAYDNDSTWPLEWYLREYPNRVYYGENPTREALDSPIVIVGSANENKVKPYLGDKYTRFNYRLVWWPMEDYKGQTLNRLWETYVVGPPPLEGTPDTAETQAQRRSLVRDNWRKLWNIIFYRYYEDYDLNEWPFVHRFALYIRNDMLNEVWDYQSGPIQFTSPIVTSDPLEGKRTEIEALQSWGSNGSNAGQFMAPRGVAVAPDGTIYVADSGNHRIQAFDSGGQHLFSFGSQGEAPGQLNEPWGLAVAPSGTVYVADTWNHRIQAFSPTGEYQFTFGSFANVQNGDPQSETGKFWGPRDVAVDAAGNVYVSDTGNKRVQKFAPDGTFLQTWGGGGIIPGAFEEPVGLALDNEGNIYVADTWNRRIQKFDSNFNPVLQWDVAGWESESIVNKPYLAVDPAGRVFISDPEGYRIIAYDGRSGEVLLTWGQYGQDLSSFQLPVGVAVDRSGDLLVVDSDSHRIMKFQVPAQAGGG